MAKQIRDFPIYIAPDISGVRKDDKYIVIDELTNETLDPRNDFDKIKIYERQVKRWFLEPTLRMANYNPKDNGFLVLMSCLSYFEGVEQYKTGTSSQNSSRQAFTNSIRRLYPDNFNDMQITNLYKQGRCGLFHDGMTKGQILIDYLYITPIKFENQDILINPKLLLEDIIRDFNTYIQLLQEDEQARKKFSRLFSNI